MKFSVSFGAAVALFSANAAAECLPFCPDGFADGVTGSTVVPESGDQTCDALLAAAPTTESEGEACVIVKRSRAVCCPETVVRAAAPCSFCPDGVTAGAGDVVLDADGWTCDVIFIHAPSVDREEEEQYCGQMRLAQLMCCIDAVEKAKDPCPFCPGGMGDGLGATLIPGGNGADCDQMMSFAPTLEQDDDNCKALLPAAPLCCPTKTTEAPATDAPSVKSVKSGKSSKTVKSAKTASKTVKSAKSASSESKAAKRQFQ